MDVQKICRYEDAVIPTDIMTLKKLTQREYTNKISTIIAKLTTVFGKTSDIKFHAIQEPQIRPYHDHIFDIDIIIETRAAAGYIASSVLRLIAKKFKSPHIFEHDRTRIVTYLYNGNLPIHLHFVHPDNIEWAQFILRYDFILDILNHILYSSRIVINSTGFWKNFGEKLITRDITTFCTLLNINREIFQNGTNPLTREQLFEFLITQTNIKYFSISLRKPREYLSSHHILTEFVEFCEKRNHISCIRHDSDSRYTYLTSFRQQINTLIAI